MSMKPVIWAILASLAISALPSAVMAANGPYFAWRGYGSWTYLPPTVYALNQPPYFALHPPVYYSHPVARPYGHLPYPYLPRPSAEKVRRIEPQVVVNPYARESDGAGVPAAATMPRRVQVVYPAAMFAQSK